MGDELITDNKDGTVSIKGAIPIGHTNGFIVDDKIYIEIWPGAALQVGWIKKDVEKE